MSSRRVGALATSSVAAGTAMLALTPDASESHGVRVLHAALDAGVRLVDTAAAYVPSENDQGYAERLVARALREWNGPRDAILVSTKGGHYRSANGFPIDGRPESLRSGCEGSLRALGVDCIDLYFLHWPDPAVPIAESAGALGELIEAGKIRNAGLSNVDRAQLEEGLSVSPIAAVQNPFSPDVPGDDVLRECTERGIAFLAYSPLGGGHGARSLAQRHPVFADVARAHGVSAARVALAWEIALSPQMIPIAGATRVETAQDSAAAMTLRLTDDEVARLSESVAVGASS